MLYRAIFLGRRALKQGGTWTILVWMAALFVGLVMLTMLVAGGSLGPLLFHPGFFKPGESAKTVARSLGSAIDGLFLVFVLALIAVPFLRAGILGLYGQVVQDQPVSWGTFWTLGKKLYGRSWGMVGYEMLYVITLALLAFLFFRLDQILGVVAAVGCGFLMLPWGLRMIGGLFVDQLTWGDSFRRSVTLRHYGPLLGGLVLGLLGYLVIFFILGLVLHFLGGFGQGILVASDVVLMGVIGPVWGLALYAAAMQGYETQQNLS